jgi:hypothetical protein
MTLQRLALQNTCGDVAIELCDRASESSRSDGKPMRPPRDVAVLVTLVILATVGMRVLTSQPVHATAPVISTPTPIPEADVVAYWQCVDARDEVELDDCGFRAALATSTATVEAASALRRERPATQ